MKSSSELRTFPLAPMSPLIRWLTIGLWLLPLGFVLGGLLSGQVLSWAIAVFLLILYGAVWLGCRPSQFVLSETSLEIQFPLWRRRIPLRTVTNIRRIDKDEFYQQFGLALRVGVGGLWGGFGWLWTARGGWLEFYISRSDRFVLVERSKGNSLLITPHDPEGLLT